MMIIKIENGSVKTEPLSPINILETIPVTKTNKE